MAWIIVAVVVVTLDAADQGVLVLERLHFGPDVLALLFKEGSEVISKREG